MASRFVSVSEEEILKINEQAVPDNTKRATKFGLKVFTEWFGQQQEFKTDFEDMTPVDLNKCLQKFYLSARKRDGSFYNKKSLTAIRAALDRHLRSPPSNKPFSIIGDSQFAEANQSLSSFLKTLHRSGDIAPTVHKEALTKEVVKKLYEAGELVEFDSLQPSKLQQTAWFVISLFLGNRGRENLYDMKKTMLILRKTPADEAFYEINKQRGGVLATKNHQGGLHDKDDESSGKIFESPGSKRCPVQLITCYLSHLNPECSNLFQKPRSANSNSKFNPATDSVWYCAVPLGHNSIENMLRGMTTRAGIVPYLTNHSIRATTVTVLSAANYESRHIKAITGHQSDTSIESYSNTPTFQQFRAMSNVIASFVDSGNSPDKARLHLVPQSTSVSSSGHSTPASSSAVTEANFVGIQHGQHLVHGLVPGGTFHGCTFNFTVNHPTTSAQQNI